MTPRPLRDDESRIVNQQIRKSTWDEGVIATFMKEATGTVWELPGGHTLLFFAEEAKKAQGATVARQTAALLAWLGTPRPFQVLLWWREDPRQVSADTWPTRREVNGGWTVSGSSLICVYRAEEWDRVVLHEMIHALEWDWPMPERPLACWGLGSQARLVPALFEAWTELLAEWLWCGWHASTEDTEGQTWLHQRQWQDAQARQILARYMRTGASWEENTSVFAYYVLKAALAPHIAFLWVRGKSGSVAERSDLVCRWSTPALATLRREAAVTEPQDMSLRMTCPY